jgi:hypothetical protein
MRFTDDTKSQKPFQEILAQKYFIYLHFIGGAACEGILNHEPK